MTEKKGPETWQEINPGCMVFRRGSAADYHTGSWRAKKPLWENREMHQVRCLLYLLPRGVHYRDTQDGFFEANLDYCKGCGICAHECWPKAIVMVNEED